MCYLEDYFLRSFVTTLYGELQQSAYSTTVIAEPTQRDDFDCELRVFIENCRSKVKKRGPLTTSEVNDAETWLIKQDQSGINLSEPSGNLKSLNIFQDDKGILRVGGRLEKASIPYSQRHPVTLAKNSKLSKIYFITLHKKLFHVGPQGLLNAVRLRFWALGGRNLARKTVHTCVVCFKCKPIPSSQIMGNLPYERVNMAPPFSITGLDLGGPYFVTYKHQRKGVLNKIYVCVCICFVTRAIHLEILSDLTSNAIIATLKRFMSRRGKCSKIFTDNATNFVGANSQLKVFYKTLNFPDQNLAAYFTEEGIEWNFIPPRAPHMGGLWEAGIKSVKYHLKRAVGRSRLTYEEFETVIIQRGKWMIEKNNVMCGTMVIVKEDFTPVCNWLLGRVVEVYHGSDGKAKKCCDAKREIEAAKNNPTVQPPLRQRERPRPLIHKHRPHLPSTRHLLALLQTATRLTLNSPPLQKASSHKPMILKHSHGEKAHWLCAPGKNVPRPRGRSRRAYQHVSDFDKGRIVAYWNCSLLYHNIGACVGRFPMTVSRIWNRWVQDSNTERRCRSQRPPLTGSREDIHVTRMALMKRTAKSRALRQELGSFARQQMSAQTIR
ncbi:integrase catalytic domain-containing protein [Trichonephila clavipes]|nr:integrase catalytic domain-containing protein [Trichonephila clavipes]